MLLIWDEAVRRVSASLVSLLPAAPGEDIVLITHSDGTVVLSTDGGHFNAPGSRDARSSSTLIFSQACLERFELCQTLDDGSLQFLIDRRAFVPEMFTEFAQWSYNPAMNTHTIKCQAPKGNEHNSFHQTLFLNATPLKSPRIPKQLIGTASGTLAMLPKLVKFPRPFTDDKVFITFAPNTFKIIHENVLTSIVGSVKFDEYKGPSKVRIRCPHERFKQWYSAIYNSVMSNHNHMSRVQCELSVGKTNPFETAFLSADHTFVLTDDKFIERLDVLYALDDYLVETNSQIEQQ